MHGYALRTENGEPQRYSWEGIRRRRRRNMVNPRDLTGRQKKKKNGEPQRYSWEGRRRRKMVNPKDIAGKAEEEKEW